MCVTMTSPQQFWYIFLWTTALSDLQTSFCLAQGNKKLINYDYDSWEPLTVTVQGKTRWISLVCWQTLNVVQVLGTSSSTSQEIPIPSY